MPMNKKYMKCAPDLPLFEAAKLLLGVGRRNLIIIDATSRMLGTVSVSDILRSVVTTNSEWQFITVDKVMTKDFIFLREGFTKEEAKKIFLEKKLDYIPILGINNELMAVEFVYDYLL